MLEKVAADYADKGVVLAKIDTDKNQFIAAQFQIQSIPTVYAMFQGQLVADLTQARTEAQLKRDARPAAQAVADRRRGAPSRGRDRAADRDGRGGAGERRCRARAVDLRPDRRDGARKSRGDCRAASARWSRPGRGDEARGADRRGARGRAKDPAIERAAAALALARTRRRSTISPALAAEVAANPDDHGGALRARRRR